MDYSLGFNGYFQLKHWTPLLVTIENRGRPIDGSVEVIVTSGSEYLQNISQATHVIDVELPSNSKKLCAFTIHLDTFIHDLRIQFRQAETILTSKSINLRPSFTEKPFAIVVDDKASPDFLAGLPQRLLPVNVRPRFLPETWYGYESVRMMMLDAGVLKGLRERQFEALLRWIEQGGSLIMTGGINVGAFQDQRTRRLLPIRIIGHQQFFELQALREFGGQALTSTLPFLLLQSSVEDADVLLQEEDVPLIFQKSVGVGQIFFLAFDVYTPPFSRWSAKATFWETLLKHQQSEATSSVPELNAQDILNALISSLPEGFQHKKLVLMLLIIYLGVLFLIFRRMQKPGRHRLRYVISLVILTILVFLTSYWLSFYVTSARNLSYNTFLHLHLQDDRSVASGMSIAGLYAIQETPYQFSFESASYPMIYIRSQNSHRIAPMPYRLHEDPGARKISGVADAWSHSFFQFQSPIAFPLVGQAIVDDSGLSLEVDNRTLHQIRDCRLYFQNTVFYIGDIIPGEEQKKLITQAELLEAASAERTDGKPYFLNSGLQRVASTEEMLSFQERVILAFKEFFGVQRSMSFFTSMQQPLFDKTIKAVHARYRAEPGVACLIGWVEEELVPVNVPESGHKGEHIVLFTWEIPVETLTK